MEYGIHGKRQMFDGKLYRALRWYSAKTEALKKARTIRAKGSLARVIPKGKGYNVYVREE